MKNPPTVALAIERLAAVSNEVEMCKAKRFASRLTHPDQLLVIDAAIEATRRLRASP